MIALRTIQSKIGNRAFKILEGREIPKHLARHLDLKRLISQGVIEDDKKVLKGKDKEPFPND